jgi:phosphoglucosamine mutase
MARKYFGTDGIRGRVNEEPLTVETIVKIAMAAAKIVPKTTRRPIVVIGKDTRLSGYMLEPALTSGFIGMGMDVIIAGPIPTPGISMLVRSLRADLGIMISASHNPYEDNGIKIFAADGYKLSDETELQIENYIDNPPERAQPAGFGRAKRLRDVGGRYIEFAKNTFPKGMSLNGLKIVLDCAHGAAYKVAPRVLWELGAEVIEIGTDPNGFNINEGCGAMHPETMAKSVIEHNADLGIALDGDADRVIIANEQGHVIDGDTIISMVAKFWQKTGQLKNNCVAGTVMSNLSMERYLKSIGINMVRTPVGDRYVVEAMKQHGLNVGGEQSGHILLTDYATTGDGIIAALQTLALLREEDKPLSEVCHLFTPFPQIMRNVKYKQHNPLDNVKVRAAIKDGEQKLNTQGRLVIRPSGTEPVIRIMAEGEDAALINSVVDDIAEVIKIVA